MQEDNEQNISEAGKHTKSGRIPIIKKTMVRAMESLIKKPRATKKGPTTGEIRTATASEATSNTVAQPPAKRPRNAPSASINVDQEASENNPVQTTSSAPPPAPKKATKAQRATVIDVTDEEDEDTDEVISIHDDEAGESSEAELERLKGDWNSPIYAFFHPIPTVGYVNGRRYHEFRCFASNCKKSVRRYLDKKDAASTGNMHKHAKICWGVETVKLATETHTIHEARQVLAKSKDGSVAAAFQVKGKGKVTYSHRQHTKSETKAEIVRWVTENTRPFSIVADRAFKNLMKTGRPEYYIPSPTTVSRDVRMVFARSRQRIAAMLRKHEGKLHFSTDAWTSPNHRAFVAVTVHFEHKGTPMSLILDVVEVAKSHTGVNLAAAFAAILEEFGIAHKILSITCDNASNNDAMIAELEELLPEFSCMNHTRCFLHIINLVARTLVRQFDVPVKAQDSLNEADPNYNLYRLAADSDIEDARTREALLNELDDDEEIEPDDNCDGWVDEMAALRQADRELIQESLKPVQMVLVKIRKLAFKTIHSTTLLLPAWAKCLEELEREYRLLPRDVQTRWNSTFDMLRLVLEHREAVDRFTADKNNELRELELSEQEWGIVRQLVDILHVLKDATLFFSRSTPNLANVIPVMDIINDRLTGKANDRSLSPAIRSSLALAKKTLNRYYARTDDAEAYRIAMILHPKYKLQYFKNAKWEQSWIDTAEDIFRNQYENMYRKDVEGESTEDTEGIAANAGVSVSTGAAGKANMFDTLLAASSSSATCNGHGEIDRYLSLDTEDVPDPLLWWTERRAMYPCLSRMALDYLSIPATSVDVERVFSRGRLILSHVRSRLSAQSTRALLCVGSWSLQGYIKDSDVQAVALMPDVQGNVEEVMEDGWDSILL